MLRGLALLAAVCGASGSAVELTPDNWDKEIAQSGKAAFIKFLAPW
jgi:protein disulfide-isomerase A6